jgi:hypothetical protein
MCPPGSAPESQAGSVTATRASTFTDTRRTIPSSRRDQSQGCDDVVLTVASYKL